MDSHPSVSTGTRGLLLVLLAPILVATLVGLVLLWPDGSGPRLRPGGRTTSGTVTALTGRPCADTAPEAGIRCLRPEVHLTSGGHVALQEQPVAGGTDIDVGDRVLVAHTVDGYELVGRERGAPMSALALGVAVLVVLVARWRGARLLGALAVTAVVLVGFGVPAVLDGSSPALVAAVAGVAIASVLTGALHGLGARSAIALVGTAVAVAAAAALGHVVGAAAHLAGLPSATPGYLSVASGRLPIAGLLLAGTGIGAVGGLVDLTTRQVDDTWDLRDAAPSAVWHGVFAAGLRRGRRHLADVASTVALAYAGVALPVLVLLTAGDQSVLAAVRGETVALEVVRALVGLAALAAAVPLTAALAAVVVVREAGGEERNDPRQFRSRSERRLWEHQ